MIKYPLLFTCRAFSKSGVSTLFQADVEGFPPITCAIPPDFKGPGGGYSPEDFFALALMTCWIATFKVFAEKSQFSYAELSVEAQLAIDRNAQGTAEIQKIDVSATIKGVQDEIKAKALAAEAEKYCLISNAIKVPKSFRYLILSE